MIENPWSDFIAQTVDGESAEQLCFPIRRATIESWHPFTVMLYLGQPVGVRLPVRHPLEVSQLVYWELHDADAQLPHWSHIAWVGEGVVRIIGWLEIVPHIWPEAKDWPQGLTGDRLMRPMQYAPPSAPRPDQCFRPVREA